MTNKKKVIILTQPILEFQLDFTYEDQKQPVLQDAQGTVFPGQCIVLCGSSGCGKSTLLRCINHLIPQFYEGELKGFCLLGGKDMKDLSIGETGRQAASVFQDPRSQFFTLNSSAEVAFGLENFGYSQKEMERRVREAFDCFHLQRLQNRDVFSLSSGERQLIAILSAWAMDTELLLLDEPTANLDYHAACQLKTALETLKAAGKTMLISEHRLSYLSGLADEYWLMDGGKILRKFSREEMLALSPEALTELGLRVTDPCQIQPLMPRVLPAENPHCLTASHISLSYPGREILKEVSLTVKTGEVLGLIGCNGCGKTTFGKAAAGLLKPAKGSFSVDGRPLSPKALSAESMFIMQEAEFQFFTNSVLNELSYGISDWDSKKEEAQALLQETGLWEIRNRHPFSLSGGQMQKLVLLMACLSEKPIIILDEPTAGLDHRSLQVCIRLIRRLQKDRIVLLITHDPELIASVCTRCAEIRNGGIALELPCQEEAAFSQIRTVLKTPPPIQEAPPVPQKPISRLDPRTKLLIVLIAMCAGIYTDLTLISFAFLSVAAAALLERHWKLLLSGFAMMAGILSLYWLFPTAGMSFLAHFFPRIILMGSAAMLILSPGEAPRTLSALRKLRVPEKAIMVCAIVFRFFPVLSGDLKIMHSSMRTRGFFLTFLDKLKAIPQYLEMILVPMVFRVLRISETLSASAEVRGIALPGKRDSFIPIHFSHYDVIIAVLTLIFTVAGLLL